MKKTHYLTAIGAAITAVVGLGPAVASAHGQDHAQANVDVHQDITARDAHGNFHPFRGTANALRSAGAAVEYGAREFGQTISGRQGRPSSELHSAHERIRMRQYAADAQQDFGGRGGVQHTHVELNSNLSRRGHNAGVQANVGGGPNTNTSVKQPMNYHTASSVRSYRDHGRMEYRGNVGGGPNSNTNVNTNVRKDDNYRSTNDHDNINGTREFREGGRSLVHGTGNAIRAAGNGIAYGAREVGQSISGRQGNARGEAASARERARMHNQAGESRGEMRDLGTHTRNVGEDITH